MDQRIDVLGLGCAAVDDLLYVDAYPAPDSKAPVRARERQCGGLVLTALVAAARMECRCAYAATLGDDDYSQAVVARLDEEGIDTALLRRHSDARPVRSTIIVAPGRQGRTILYELDGVVGTDTTWPEEDAIRRARLLLIDHFGVAGMIRAAGIARAAGIPVVADFEKADDPRLPELLGLVDHLILSRDFASQVTGRSEPSDAVRALWTSRRRAAVVTCGDQGCWFISDDQPAVPRHEPALAVEAVDTTGCGDVFHGAYAAALVHGLPVAGAVRFATVAAGLKATCRGGQEGIPSRAAVETELANKQLPFPASGRGAGGEGG